MQLNFLQEDPQPIKPEKVEKSPEQESIADPFWRQRVEQNRKEFEARFKYGATTVIYHDEIFYFWGDISHCGEENIFHNARVMRLDMLKNKKPYGHMNYNDPPEYERPKGNPSRHASFWEWKEWDRKNVYSDDLYRFNGDEIILVDRVSK